MEIRFCHKLGADIAVCGADLSCIAANVKKKVEEELDDLKEVIILADFLHGVIHNLAAVFVRDAIMAIDFNIFVCVHFYRPDSDTMHIGFNEPALPHVQGGVVPVRISNDTYDPAQEMIAVDKKDVSRLELFLKCMHSVEHFPLFLCFCFINFFLELLHGERSAMIRDVQTTLLSIPS